MALKTTPVAAVDWFLKISPSKVNKSEASVDRLGPSRKKFSDQEKRVVITPNL